MEIEKKETSENSSWLSCLFPVCVKYDGGDKYDNIRLYNRCSTEKNVVQCTLYGGELHIYEIYTEISPKLNNNDITCKYARRWHPENSKSTRPHRKSLRDWDF